MTNSRFGSSRLAITAAALGLTSGLTLGGLSAFAGGDKVVFPDNWDKGVLYNTVDRYDVKQYRELWSTAAAVEAARKGEPIPDRNRAHAGAIQGAARRRR